MRSSDQRGTSPRMTLFMVLITFMAGVVLAPLARWREDAPVVALVALAPFLFHLRHGSD